MFGDFHYNDKINRRKGTQITIPNKLDECGLRDTMRNIKSIETAKIFVCLERHSRRVGNKRTFVYYLCLLVPKHGRKRWIQEWSVKRLFSIISFTPWVWVIYSVLPKLAYPYTTKVSKTRKFSSV